MPSKQERLEELFRRLLASPPCTTAQEAFLLVCSLLNDVEDELTGIPFNPDRWQDDGRMYPPQEDSARVEGEPEGVVRYRSRKHHLYIRDNGSIAFRNEDRTVVLMEKPGADGKGVWN